MLMSMLLPWMLLPWMTVDTEASEDLRERQKISLGEYRLAPGDRVKIVIFDQEQLSGEFIVEHRRNTTASRGAGRCRWADCARGSAAYPGTTC